MTINSITLVDSLDEAVQFIDWIAHDSGNLIGIDTETTGLHWWRDDIRLVQFSNSSKAWVIPVHRWKGILHEAFDRIEYTDTVFHNWKFDCHFLTNEGFTIPQTIHDTMTLAHLLYSDRLMGLKSLAKLVDPSYHNFDIALKDHYSETGYDFKTIPYDDPFYYCYAGMDPYVTHQLCRIFLKELSHQTTNLQNLYVNEMDSQRALFDMERVGIKVDLRYLDFLNEKYLNFLDVSKKWGKEVYNTDFTSRNSVISGLMDVGWQPIILTEKGNISIAKDVLSLFKHPLAETYIKYKKIQKYNSTYVEGIKVLLMIKV